MTANDIIRCLLKEARSQHQYAMANFFVGQFEMDIMGLTQSGYVWEYEVKISRADFVNDFKKESWNKSNKHDLLKSGKGGANRFFFVVPEGLVKENEVPPHCGLIYAGKDRETTNVHFQLIKNAPLLKKEKRPAELVTQIGWRCYNRNFPLINENRRLKERVKELEYELRKIRPSI